MRTRPHDHAQTAQRCPLLGLALAAVLAVSAVFSGCTTTTMTTSTTHMEGIPELRLQAELQKVGKADAEKLSKELEILYPLGVYEETILPVYWRDDLKNDLIILVPTQDNRVQLLKVEVNGARTYFETKGERNGKRFSNKGLLPQNRQ